MEIRAVDIVRDPDGLALSSRNAYLSAHERTVAAALNRVLREVAEAVAGGTPAAEACARGRAALEAAGFSKVDYVEVRDARTLEPVERPRAPARAFAAAWIGRTRLIDNMPVNASAR